MQELQNQKSKNSKTGQQVGSTNLYKKDNSED